MVTDSLGGTASTTVTVTVSGTLTAPVISVSSTSIKSGQSATLSTTTSFSGGTPTYTCQWLEEVPTASSYTTLGSSFACTAGSTPSASTGTLSTTGTWHFELQVTDSNHPADVVMSNAVTVTVTSTSKVTLSITLTLATGGPIQTFTLSGCAVSPTTIRGDGSAHTFTAQPNCLITISDPPASTNSRYMFDASSTLTITTCSSGTCTAFKGSYYHEFRSRCPTLSSVVVHGCTHFHCE